ncbi:kinase-regulated stress-responsive transcription factor skn7 [Thoreauomyces humboldtii]|nr:kinase-regulated stress-responsive transcription factor skn7 [Thoreauomyces humboldtii]
MQYTHGYASDEGVRSSSNIHRNFISALPPPPSHQTQPPYSQPQQTGMPATSASHRQQQRGGGGAQRSTRRKQRAASDEMDNVCSFVQKLYSLVDSDEHRKYIQWNEAGDVFIIMHCDEFAETVLPGYFKHGKFPSFVRQLNIYGFYRVSDARKTPLVRSKEACVFSHRYFKRTRKELLPLIRRKIGPKKYGIRNTSTEKPSATKRRTEDDGNGDERRRKMMRTSTSGDESGSGGTENDERREKKDEDGAGEDVYLDGLRRSVHHVVAYGDEGYLGHGESQHRLRSGSHSTRH